MREEESESERRLREPVSSPSAGCSYIEIWGDKDVESLGRGLFYTTIKDSKTEYCRISHLFPQFTLAEKEMASRQSGRQKTQATIEVVVLILNSVGQASRLETHTGFLEAGCLLLKSKDLQLID